MTDSKKEKERYARLLHASSSQTPGTLPSEHALRILRVLKQLTRKK